ncbi:hypothetical protein [Altericroceibacterium endophyticum]|uniref:Uncharacterized protein n=1 Tax=Altericroceibacterium endophyticum TaxID=1808508 RepID=A0A6I4T6X7_9SPHN|nr:hypothetical protein [Altericroceibacterium endophyticum]MXO65962.1 hypothetical protein [Altericroceibacterium endophyticum]
MAKKVKAPPGLDYEPVLGEMENLSFGVAQADPNNELTAERFLGRRLFPVMKPHDMSLPWPQPTCHKFDVILPPGASDEFWDPQRLVKAYDRQCFNSIRDLVVIVTLRFAQVDVVPQITRLHEVWELGRGFAANLVEEHSVAVVVVMHVPARAAKPGFPHLHLMIPARQLLPSGFGKFARPLATDEGRAIVEDAWKTWQGARNAA